MVQAEDELWHEDLPDADELAAPEVPWSMRISNHLDEQELYDE